MMMNIFFKILNPGYLLNFCKKARKILVFMCALAFAASAYLIINSPDDYQQGEMVRIMYIHVPSAWLSIMIYCIIGFSAISNLIWRAPSGFLIGFSAAPIGSAFALITLITGMIWGKPIWGAWWVWDARLTSMLILFIFYICYMIVSSSSRNLARVEKPSSAIAILGMINIPIVKFSVDIWHSLHQPASVFRSSGSAIDPQMLKPLFAMFIANFILFLLLFTFRFEKSLQNFKVKNN